MKVLAIALVIALCVGAAIFFWVIPKRVDRMHNFVYADSAPLADPANLALHGRLLIADLHTDSLLWDRNLNVRNSAGHVDVPRLIEGNVALEGFSVVTKTPRGLNIDSNAANSDNITLLAIAQRWPRATWSSLLQRAVYQAQRMHDVARQSSGALTIIKTRADLSSYLARRREHRNLTAAWLALEGAHALEGDLANLDVLFDAGFRVMAPSHLFDSDVGGSASGVDKGGLTQLGRDWVKRMEDKRMIIDLAHASARTLDDVLAIASRPIIVSHTGVAGTCDNNRNLTDAQLRRIAHSGGLIGVGFWETATCGRDVAAIVKAIRYAVDVAGVDAIALGSDWDGYVATPIDASQLARVTDALVKDRFSEPQIEKIMGGNAIRLLSQLLP
ncbi:MAG: membrane dipeptidase [Betaproteobacteria bacterium]